MQNILVLGATGSVGLSTLDVVPAIPINIALCAGR